MEIGSIFDISPNLLFLEANGELRLPFMQNESYECSLFQTGRGGIESLLRELKNCNAIKKLALPTFLCSSIYEAADRAGVKYEFYDIEKNLDVDADRIADLSLDEGDVLYLISYFGKEYTSPLLAYIEELKNRGIIIIEDVTLSLLTNDNICGKIGHYVIGSLRKWFPIADGAFVASQKHVLNFNKDNDCSEYAMYYLLAQIMKGNYLKDGDNNKDVFLGYVQRSMKALFSDYAIRDITPISKAYLVSNSYKEIADTRVRNYMYLYDLLSDCKAVKPIVKIVGQQVPMGMIVRTIQAEYRDDLYQYLISNNIYCNIHWRRNIGTDAGVNSSGLSACVLTVPCDQRYDKPEMEYISSVINEWDSRKR